MDALVATPPRRYSPLTVVALVLCALIAAMLLQRYFTSGPVWFIPIRHRILLYASGLLLLFALTHAVRICAKVSTIRIHLLELLLLCAAASLPLGLNIKEASIAPDNGTAGMWLFGAAADLFAVGAGALWGFHLANRRHEVRTAPRLLYAALGMLSFAGLVALPVHLLIAEHCGTPTSQPAMIATVVTSYLALFTAIMFDRRARNAADSGTK